MRLAWRRYLGCALISTLPADALAQLPQAPFTWSEIRDRVRATNPTLQAGRIGIDESKAAEITAYLRPNPQWSLAVDQVGNTEEGNPFSASNVSTMFSYLHERQQKRELRRDSAGHATAIATSTQADLERNLLSTLRSAFVQVLQARAFRGLAAANLAAHEQGEPKRQHVQKGVLR